MAFMCTANKRTKMEKIKKKCYTKHKPIKLQSTPSQSTHPICPVMQICMFLELAYIGLIFYALDFSFCVNKLL